MNTNQKVEQKTYDIVNGPSADRLFDAVKYAYDKSCARIPVEFGVAIGYTTAKTDPGCCYIPAKIRNLRIIGIEHEDGSGNSFNIRGYCDADLSRFTAPTKYHHYNIKIYYNTKTREGTITFC